MLGLGSVSPDMMWGEGDDEMMGGAASDPLSIRLNNPGAIRRNNIQWAGMAPEQNSPFVTFATPEDGIRAMSQLLDTYGRKHGLTTVAGIIGRWAPPSENNTGGYVKRVADTMGVDPTQPLNLSDPAVKTALVEAMSTVEAGRKHYTRDQIASALTGQPGAKPMPQQMPYDEDQGLANIEAMGQRVGQMQPAPSAGLSALPGPQQQPQGLSALSPYLQLARQLSPSRESNWGDALINAGAAMMQSTRPDFLGGLGAGLQAGNNTLSQGREQMRGDGLKQFSLAMDLARFDQKDGGEYAMSDGVLYNKRTGATQQVGAGKAPQTREVKRGDKIITQEWNGAMWKDVGEAPAHRPEKPGEVESLIRMAGIEPNSPEGRAMAARILEKKAKGDDGGPFPGSSIDASSYNNMIAYNEKVRTGQPTTPQEDMAYSIAYQHASKPTRWTTPDGAMYEAPGIDVSGMVAPKVGAPAAPVGPSSARQTQPPAAASGQPEPRPGGSSSGAQPGARLIVPPDEKPVAGDSAGRFALVPEARQALDQAQKGYFPDGKSFDRATAGVAWANVPGTKGAEIYNAVSRVIANRLRIESGAAAPPAEVEAMVKRYLPAPWDSEDMARQKLDGLKQYFDAFAVSATKGAGPAMRGDGGPSARPNAATDIPPPDAFATMDRAAIDQMTPRVRDMTDDQLRALQARRRQLLGIPSGSGMTGSGGAP